MNAIPTSEHGVFVVGTLFDRKYFSIQHGWVKPDKPQKLISCFINSRENAKLIVETLSKMPMAERIGPIGIFEVNISISAGTAEFVNPQPVPRESINGAL